MTRCFRVLDVRRMSTLAALCSKERHIVIKRRHIVTSLCIELSKALDRYVAHILDSQTCMFLSYPHPVRRFVMNVFVNPSLERRACPMITSR